MTDAHDTITRSATYPDYLAFYVMDYPVNFDGEHARMVCQGHADVCAIRGHATATRNGVVSSYCPRCGEYTSTDDDPAKYGPCCDGSGYCCDPLVR